jgi:DNA uptake protein ComE-like DNA-binding protein
MTKRLLLGIAALILVAGCAVVRIGEPVARVDVNRADAQTLAALPGIGPDDAARIIAHRPYLAKEDLRTSHVLTDAQYAAVADRLSVGAPAVPEYLKSVPPMPAAP